MRDPYLPPELERVERLLDRDAWLRPPTGLRQRVLGNVRFELGSERRRARKRFVATFAVVVLMGASLLSGVSQSTVLAVQQPQSPPSVREVARRLQILSPDIAQRPLYQQAALRHIGAGTDSWISLDETPSGHGYHDP